MGKATFFHSLSVKFLIVFALIICSKTIRAKEGMWIPATLKKQEAAMKALGMRIPVEKLYSEDGTGLNNAVVLFGKGCTGEIISSGGLVLTNHHCGYGSVQALSSPGHDYFADGFWAMNNEQELPCPGLTVTFIRRMENVTDKILAGLSDTLRDIYRDSIVEFRIKNVEKQYAAASGLEASIKPYYDRNQYWVTLTETFRDVRLVGFPPNGIGYFGGDYENWIWPRHTGDFSLFRVYAGPGNKPADYAATNQPYAPKEFFRINVSGYSENDFTMVYGFPGTTHEYIPSTHLSQVSAISDPISVAARTLKLDVWTKHMSASRDVFLKYTSKRAGVANGWKKWQGEMHGLELNHVIDKKIAYETEFQTWANGNTAPPYAATLLPEMRTIAQTVDSMMVTDQYINEALLGVELISQGAAMQRLAACFRGHLPNNALRDSVKKVVGNMAWFYKNYDVATDKDVFRALVPLYFAKCPTAMPPCYTNGLAASHGDFSEWSEMIYKNSLAASFEKLTAFADKATYADSALILSDPSYQLYNSIVTMRAVKIGKMLPLASSRVKYLERLYTAAQMLKDKDKDFYPDANLTLRVAYGQVKGMDPEGDAPYSFQTTLDEAVALNDTTIDVYTVPKKLMQLYNDKDYGRWAVKGTVPLAFIASNHTSGGNSGSPVLNAKGELIGTNFDRPWEGTMSDYYFDPHLCRNITLDVRYTLFVTEKLGGAGWLLDEMDIVKTNRLNSLLSRIRRWGKVFVFI